MKKCRNLFMIMTVVMIICSVGFGSSVESIVDLGEVQLETRVYEATRILDKGDKDVVVVFLPGMGDGVDAFNDLATWVNETYGYPVLTFSRAGVGNSTSRGVTTTAVQMQEDAKKLVESLGFKKHKILLITHSIGHYPAHVWAKEDKSAIIGATLIDPTLEDMSDVAKETLGPNYWGMMSGYLDTCEMTTEGIYISEIQVQRAYGSFKKDVLSVVTGGNIGADAYADNGDGSGYEEAWITGHDDITNTSRVSKHFIDENSGHYVHYENPEIVEDAIEWMINNLDEKYN